MFVDSSGRRSKALRRIGLLVGGACANACAGVLGAAFMGWGTSLAPSSLLPFGNAQGDRAPGGIRPQGGTGRQAGLPGGAPSAPPSDTTAAPSASPSASASDTAD
ncbi:hypothetical protein ACIRU3_02440 [Streptomyces sp. NPDC101151]|uniref:hypothetical protein n=1 Tax=Streptomyces sp. NPDC101151 TaxID=3366115 RepID=UPI0037F3303E